MARNESPGATQARIEKLMQLRYAMQGADVPVVLTSWMREVEKLLAEMTRERS